MGSRFLTTTFFAYLGMTKRGRPKGATNKKKVFDTTTNHTPTYANANEDDVIISMPIDIIRTEFNTFVGTVTERLTKLEAWANHITCDIDRYKDLDSVTADMTASIESLLVWREEIRALVRAGTLATAGGQKPHNVVVAEQQQQQQPSAVKNQELAKLQGQLATLESKIDRNTDDILGLKRKYLLPDTYKPENGSFIISDSISAIDRKLNSQEKIIVTLQRASKEMGQRYDGHDKLINEMKATATTTTTAAASGEHNRAPA